MHYYDRQYGRKVLMLTRVPKGYLAPRPDDLLYTPNDRFASGEFGTMIPVRMRPFTDYCFAREDRREAIVRNYIDNKGGGGASPYVNLLPAIQNSGPRAEALKKAPPQPSPRWRDFADDYDILLRRVIYFCEGEDAEIHAMPRTQVVVGGLPVYVEPEVWIESDLGKWTVKLNLGRNRMPSRRADMAFILLERAQRSDPYWRAYFPRCWDVQHDEVPQQRDPGDNLRQRMDDAAADFLERYDNLNQQPPLLGDGDGAISE